MRRYSINELEQLSKKQLMLMLVRKQVEENQPISITGMACRFPGSINTPEQLWDVVINKKQVVSDIPDDRWNADCECLHEYKNVLNKGGYISGINRFDADFFGISDDEALHMDPQHRILLETVWRGIEDANLTLKDLRKKQVGVFVAMSVCEYLYPSIANGVSADKLSPHMGLGTTLSSAAGRIAYHLGITGPALTIDTACSSSIVALHQACQSLRKKECDIAIVSGVHLLMSPLTTIVFSKAGLISEKGCCTPFSDDADGHVRSEGCGVIVLKRLEDARKDKDIIYANVKGSAAEQNGNRAAVAAPSGDSQSTVIRKAMEMANITPDQVDYVEAQGNGASLAGLVEIEALSSIFTEEKTKEEPLYLGTVKPNIGYMEIASGMAGLIKVASAIDKGVIPPVTGISSLDKRITWANLPLDIPFEATGWPEKDRRIAGLSCFGITGTNSHVVLESNTDSSQREADRENNKKHESLCLLSAKTEESLMQYVKSLYQFVTDHPSLDLYDICAVLANHREHFKYRYAFKVNSRTELLSQLKVLYDRHEDKGTEKDKPALLKNNVEIVIEDENTNVIQSVKNILSGHSLPLLNKLFSKNMSSVDGGDDLLSLDENDNYQALDSLNSKLVWYVYVASYIEMLKQLGIKISKVKYTDEEIQVLANFAVGKVHALDIGECFKRLSLNLRDNKKLSHATGVERIHQTIECESFDCTMENYVIDLLDRESLVEILVEKYKQRESINWDRFYCDQYKKIKIPGYEFCGKEFLLEGNRWQC